MVVNTLNSPPIFNKMASLTLLPPPHTHEKKGIAERRHRNIVETGLSLLHDANLPLTFWTHAFQTAPILSIFCPHPSSILNLHMKNFITSNPPIKNSSPLVAFIIHG